MWNQRIARHAALMKARAQAEKLSRLGSEDGFKAMIRKIKKQDPESRQATIDAYWRNLEQMKQMSKPPLKASTQEPTLFLEARGQ